MMSEHTDRTLRQDFALELEQFHNDTRARPEELAAIRRRIRSAKQDNARRPSIRLLSMGGLVAAAALAIGVSIGLTDNPMPIQALALSAESWSELEASEHVQLGFSGQGSAQVEGKVHDIDWKQGRLSVSVTPSQEIDLTVRTPEANILVVGTVFEVQRNTLGTTISVERGTVSVQCGQRTARQLTTGEKQTCLPTTAVGLLNRAQDLKRASPDDAVAAIAMGLELVDASSTDFDDLHYRAAEIHYEAGRPEAALESARSALSGGDGTYTAEAHSIAAHQALTLGSCSDALPHLIWMTEHDHAEAQDLAVLAQCVSDTDPGAALRWLEAAEAKAIDPVLKERIRTRIEHLQH
jgi:hypothetical protein